MDARITIKKNSDFHRLYSRGKSAVDPCLVVYCRRNGLGRNRTGYTVSAKLGGAVVRNRVRRRLRAIYRLNAPSLKKSYDIIIVARTRAVKASYQELDRAFMKTCRRLGLSLEESV